MARRGTRLSLLAAIGLALLVAVLAGHKVLSSRGESRAHAPRPPQPPAAESSLDGPAGAPSVAAGTSDRERILAWAARHRGVVSFDPVERFLEDTTGERTWHDDSRDMPDGEIVAVLLGAENLDAALAELPGGVTIPMLELPNGKLTPGSAAHLVRALGLRGLYVSQDITDAVVAVLGSLSELEWLLIEGEAVTDDSLVHLTRLTKLRHLGLIGTGITGDSGASRHLPAGLEELYVSQRRGPNDSFVDGLPPLPNLRELTLPECSITDAALPKIGTFLGLRELHLGNNEFSDAGVAHLKGLRNLERLDLASSPITDEGLAAIAQLGHLEELNLRGTRVTCLAGVGDLARLHSLDLQSTTATDEGLGSLLPLKKLSGPYLSNTRITDRGLAYVGALSALRSLDLAETGVTNAGLAHLQGLGSLEDLDLSRTGVGDDGVRQLARLGSLCTLDVTDTAVTADGLLALKDLSGLRHVDIRAIGPADRARLAAAMPACEFE